MIVMFSKQIGWLQGTLFFSKNNLKHTNLDSHYILTMHSCSLINQYGIGDAYLINQYLIIDKPSFPTLYRQSLVLNLIMFLMDDFTWLSLWLVSCKTEWCGKATNLLHKYDQQTILHFVQSHNLQRKYETSLCYPYIVMKRILFRQGEKIMVYIF